MILQGDFYTVLHPITAPGGLHAVLELNPDHPIFRGHFPSQPVVPGVCMLQMITELLEAATGKSPRLLKGSELKFLAVIDPRQNNLINVELSHSPDTNGGIAVAARLFYSEAVFFKFKGIFAAE